MRNRRLAKQKRLAREAEEIMNRLRAPYVKPVSKRFVNWTYAEPEHPYPEKLDQEIFQDMIKKFDDEVMRKIRSYK